MNPALELRTISKRFGEIEALDGVNFTLARGEVHALLGENGAGKSTLMKIAFGLLRPDAGSILVDGEVHRVKDPLAARQLGIGMVHQHFTSIPAFTVSENLALAAGWPIRRVPIRARLRELATRTGMDLDPDARVDNLSAALKQRLEVLKALATNARVLLLDEPSAVLSPIEAESFLGVLKGLKGTGISSVLITHKLSEVLTAADRVTILRRGRVVHSGSTREATAEQLSALMLGEAPPPRQRSWVTTPGSVRVQCKGLVVPSSGGGSGLKAATFEVRAGELVGIAAVEGNGQRELLRAIAGLSRPTAGSLIVDGLVSFVPEDRSREGLIGELTLTEHLVLSQGEKAPWVHRPWVDWEAAANRTRELAQDFSIRAASPHSRIRTLSGGNQQRLILAAALEGDPQVLVAEGPTRGLDLRAT